MHRFIAAGLVALACAVTLEVRLPAQTRNMMD